jgi:hypothetical protein
MEPPHHPTESKCLLLCQVRKHLYVDKLGSEKRLLNITREASLKKLERATLFPGSLSFTTKLLLLIVKCVCFSLSGKKKPLLFLSSYFTTKNIVLLKYLLFLVAMNMWNVNTVPNGDFILSDANGIDTIQLTVKLTHVL